MLLLLFLLQKQMRPNLLLLLGVVHRHLQGVALAPRLSAILKVLHHLLIPRLQTRRELALSSTLISHFYQRERIY